MLLKLYLYYMRIIISESQLKLLVESLNFSEVYKQTYPNIYRNVCLKFSKGDKNLANEYCQLGYITVSQKLDKYSGTGSLEGWVRTVVSNSILNLLRTKKREIKTIDDVNFERTEFEDVQYSEDWMGGSISTDDIIKAIESLPESYKQVVFLHYFEKKSFDEIGQMFGTHSGTQRGYMFRAKKMLQDKLGKLTKR